jgi:hypothetical protein
MLTPCETAQLALPLLVGRGALGRTERTRRPLSRSFAPSLAVGVLRQVPDTHDHAADAEAVASGNGHHRDAGHRQT